MHIDQLRSYCRQLKAVTEHFPFNETVLVFKVLDKAFLLIDLADPVTMNLKCDPEYALELREKYEEVSPGYHMNKKHWNTVDLHGSLDDALLISFIRHSYEMVVAGMTLKQRKLLNEF